MCERHIVVKNQKANDLVRLTIYEQVPKSTDEKIRVKLYQPETATVVKNESSLSSASHKGSIAAAGFESVAAVAAPNASAAVTTELKLVELGVRLNAATNNLEWTLELKPAEERELVVKWGVECASGETRRVDYVEDVAECDD